MLGIAKVVDAVFGPGAGGVTDAQLDQHVNRWQLNGLPVARAGLPVAQRQFPAPRVVDAQVAQHAASSCHALAKLKRKGSPLGLRHSRRAQTVRRER